MNSKYGTTEDLHPSLTLFNVEKVNKGKYICNVTVTNPYDGKIWSGVGAVKVVIKMTTSNSSGGEKV